MNKFKLENVWICELSYVYRRKQDDMMSLNESNSQHVLIMKEDACPKENVVHIKGQDYIPEQEMYFNLEGEKFYHGTQKGVFNPSDIGKIFVVRRRHIPDELLTDEEKNMNEISAERIEELNRRLQFHSC